MDEINELIESGGIIVRNGKLLIQWEDIAEYASTTLPTASAGVRHED